MTTGGRLPERELRERLGKEPQLPARPGGPAPYEAPERTPEEEFPGPLAQPTIREASRVPRRVGVAAPLGAPVPAPAGEEEAAPPTPNLLIPNSFDEMIFHAVLLTPAREVSVIVEQTIAAGASGSVTVSIPANVVDIARFFPEGGDGSVSYRIEVDGAGRTTLADHRVTGVERQFARYWEKFNTVLISFTNNDAVNSALLQIEWVSVQIDTVKWLRYRDNLRAWSRLLGVQE